MIFLHAAISVKIIRGHPPQLFFNPTAYIRSQLVIQHVIGSQETIGNVRRSKIPSKQLRIRERMLQQHIQNFFHLLRIVSTLSQMKGLIKIFHIGCHRFHVGGAIRCNQRLIIGLQGILRTIFQCLIFFVGCHVTTSLIYLRIEKTIQPRMTQRKSLTKILKCRSHKNRRFLLYLKFNGVTPCFFFPIFSHIPVTPEPASRSKFHMRVEHAPFLLF